MNKISIVLKEHEKKTFGAFKPTRQWYANIGIGQRRWTMLLNGEAIPNVEELTKLAHYFGCKIADLYEFEPKLISA